MKRRYYFVIAAYCAGIFWLSHQSSPPMPVALRFPGEDKIAHMVLYGGLAGLISVCLHQSPGLFPRWVMRFGPVLFASFYGVTDEVHQYFIPLRTPDVFDLVADFAGAALAHAACLRFFKWRAGRLAPEVQETEST